MAMPGVYAWSVTISRLARGLRLEEKRRASYALAKSCASAKFGAIAQLGERLNGIQEVGGSIPPGSTTPLFIDGHRKP